jgi:osmotically-inducible protein OsmY
MKRNTDELKQEIAETLYWDSRIDHANVKVDVVEDRVLISGTVASNSERDAVITDVWNASGVRMIDNQIRVSHPDIEYNNLETESHLNSLIKWDADIGDQDIHVDFEHGRARLSGSVNALWKKYKARTLCSNVRGVNTIENDIAVAGDEKPADELIAQDLMTAFNRNAQIPDEMIDIIVENGMVTLKGKVPTWQIKNAVFETALYTGGVSEVRNEIEILET